MTDRAISKLVATLAVLYALPTLFYPLGADQALFATMGRALLGGRLPYVDIVDIKPPAIFFLYALPASLGRATTLGVRLLDLGVAVALGFVLRELVPVFHRASGARPSIGITLLTTLGLYFGAFDYWCVGQVEIFQATLAAAALLAAARVPRLDHAAALAGAASALSIAFKPSLLFLPPLVALTLRARREPEPTRGTLRSAAFFAIAATAAIGLVLLPFALRSNGLARMREVLVDFQRIYIADSALRTFSTNWDRTGRFIEWFLIVVGFVGIRAAMRRERALLQALGACILWLALAATNVFAQKKFLDYHWVIILPAMTLTVLVALSSFEREIVRFGVVGLGIAVGIFPIDFPTPSETANYHHSYGRHLVATARALVHGTAPPLDLHQGGFGNDVGPLVRAAAAIRESARDGDTLCARAFRPLPYVLTGLDCPSRFPWEQHTAVRWHLESLPTADADRLPPNDVRMRWANEHRAALAAHPPGYVITFPEWADDAATLSRDGYREFFRERTVSVWRRSSPE
jgi:hypothetical protein